MSDREGQRTVHEVTADGSAVILSNEGDSWFYQQFDNWDQLNAFISKLRACGHLAWGADHSENEE